MTTTLSFKTLTAIALATSMLVGAVPAFAGPLPAALSAVEQGDSIFIDAARLATVSGSPGFKLIDVRTPELYATGHLEGAISLPNAALNGEINGIRSEVLPIDQLEQAFAQAGLSYDDTIVIYGDQWVGKSYIAFNQAGFENVHILEGGLEGWTGAVSTVAVASAPSNFKLTRSKTDIVDKDYVLARVGNPEVFILDSRTEENYNKGFIPGSHNVPYTTFVEGATLKPVDELVAILTTLGISKDSEIITTCGAGPAASDQLAVLRDLGYTNIKLYDGSWNEWQLDPDAPKETKG